MGVASVAGKAEPILDGGPTLVLDGKGRVTIPSRHRELLAAMCQDQLTVTKALKRCLTIFPRPLWLELQAKAMGWSVEMDDWRRLYIGSATHVEIDSASRVLIAPELREWAGIDRDVYLFGMGRRFELWDKARYDAHEASVLAQRPPEEVRNLVM